MKKISLSFILVLLLAWSAFAFPPTPPSSAGSGSVATDTIFDAAGDLVYGTADNTAGRLALGTAYQLLMTNSGATAPAWASSFGGQYTFSAVNAASGSATPITLSGTLGAFNGSDTFRGLYFNYTNANHSSTSNTVALIDVAAMSGDAESNFYGIRFGNFTGTTGSDSEVERAIQIGTGYDAGVYSDSNLYSRQGTTGGSLFLMEGSGGGTNYVALKAADAITTDGTITVGGGTNTFSFTNGTASLDIAAAATLNVDTNLTVQTGAVTLIGNAAGSTLVLPASSLTLPTPTASGQFPQASGAGVFATSAYKLPTTVPTDKYILVSNGTDIVGSNTLQIGTFIVPSADADPTAATAGQLVHDNSDTAASGGGNLKFADGTNVRTVVSVGATFTHITKYEYLPIKYAEDDDSVTAPAAVAEIGTTGLQARAFDKDADEGVLFFWQVPSDWVSGFKYRVYYSPAVTTSGANMTAAFSLSGCSVGNSDAIACTEGDIVTVTDELTETTDAENDLIVTGWSGAVTVTNIAAGEIAKLLFIRDISEDDYTDGDLKVVGIEIKYVSKLAPFSDY